MLNPRLCFFAATTLAVCGVAGCTSADTRAANNAAAAQAAYDQGHFDDASSAISKALALRDDNVDYWLLKAHIDLKTHDLDGAFSDYEYVIQLDHGNIEALQALCQLGTVAGPADRVSNYADQLLVLIPDAPAALTAKGNVALVYGDTAKAEGFADRVLAQNPQDVSALNLKAGVLIVRGQFAQAAALIEKTVTASVNPVSRLQSLQTVYSRANDRPSYVRTVQRLAKAAPYDADIQLDYADTLYQDGQNAVARSVVQAVMEHNAADLHVAAAILTLWLNAGPQALDTTRMVADAAQFSLVMKADYAQFANEIGRPDIAIAILHGVDQGDPTPENSNAKAALAYALGVSGHHDAAMAQLNAILSDGRDPDQPVALLARARLFAAAHDYVDAIKDARLLVANDRTNATAYLALADILRASGSADLSDSALREGFRAIPDATRLAARLAATLAARGDTGQAAEVAHDLARKVPMDPRAQQLMKTYPAKG